VACGCGMVVLSTGLKGRKRVAFCWGFSSCVSIAFVKVVAVGYVCVMGTCFL